MSEYDFTKQLAGRSQHEVARSIGQDAGPLTFEVAAEALPAIPPLPINPVTGRRAIISDAGVCERTWDDVQREKLRFERQQIIPLPDPLLLIDQQPIVTRQRYFESLLGIRDGQDPVAIYNIKTTFLFDMLTYRRIAELIEWRRFMYRAFFVVHANFEARFHASAADIEGDMKNMLAMNGRALDLTLPSRYGEIEEQFKNATGPLGSWKTYPNLSTTIVTDAGGAPPETADGKYKHVLPVYQHIAEGFTTFAQRNRTVNTPANHLFDRAVDPTDDKLCGGVFDIMEELQRPESTPALDVTCSNLMGHAFESVDLFSTYLMRRSGLASMVFPKLSKPFFCTGKEGAVVVEYDHYDDSILASPGFEKNIPPQEPEHLLKASEFSLRDFFNLCVRTEAVRFEHNTKQLGQSDLVSVLQFYLKHFEGDATKAYAMLLFWLELRLLATFVVQFCFPCVDEMTRHTTKAEAGGFPFKSKVVRSIGKEEEVSQWNEKEWRLKFQFPIPYAQDPAPSSESNTSNTPANFPSWCSGMYMDRSKADPKAAAAELAQDVKCAEIFSSAHKAWNQPNVPLESMWAPYPDLEALGPVDITKVRMSIGRKFMMPFTLWPLERICDPLSIKPRTDVELEQGGGDGFSRRMIPAFMHCMKQRLEFCGLQDSVLELLARLHGLGYGKWTLDSLSALRQTLREEHAQAAAGIVAPPNAQAVAGTAAPAVALEKVKKPKRGEEKPLVNVIDEISEASSSDEEEEESKEELLGSKRHKNSETKVTPSVVKAVASSRAGGRRGPVPSLTPLSKGAAAAAAASSMSAGPDTVVEGDEEDSPQKVTSRKKAPTPPKQKSKSKAVEAEESEEGGSMDVTSFQKLKYSPRISSDSTIIERGMWLKGKYQFRVWNRKKKTFFLSDLAEECKWHDIGDFFEEFAEIESCNGDVFTLRWSQRMFPSRTEISRTELGGKNGVRASIVETWDRQQKKKKK